MNAKSPKRKKWMRRILAGIIVLAILIQLVPYGHAHNNPPVTGEPLWDSPQTRDLFFHACGDCHSNETVWPWYSHLAPASWLVQSDVDEGREEFNASTWDTRPKHGNRAAEMIRKDEMPLWFYVPLHREARLSEEDKAALISGLVATFGDKPHRHD